MKDDKELRLRLPARVPNEGARRLAWWICEAAREHGNRVAPVVERVERELDRMTGVIDRAMYGEFVPGGELGHRLSKLTNGFVLCGDWWKSAEGGWGARPRERAVQRRAA